MKKRLSEKAVFFYFFKSFNYAENFHIFAKNNFGAVKNNRKIYKIS